MGDGTVSGTRRNGGLSIFWLTVDGENKALINNYQSVMLRGDMRLWSGTLVDIDQWHCITMMNGEPVFIFCC